MPRLGAREKRSAVAPAPAVFDTCGPLDWLRGLCGAATWASARLCKTP